MVEAFRNLPEVEMRPDAWLSVLTPPAPVLSSTFESTVPGLFFTGPTAAFSFGPLLRFACGAGFAAQRLTRRFA